MKQVSVIIPTFDRADVLRRTLNLLAVQTLAQTEFEVIVIDDGSSDDTPRVLEEFAGKDILNLRYESQENAGQGTARNRGIEFSTGSILLFLGDDMLPQPGFVEAHLRFHILNPETERVALGFTTWHAESRPNSFMRWLDTSGVQFRFHDLQSGQITDYRRFYTGNISLKKAFLAEDRFDTDFHGWGWEDIELGYRLEQRGLQLTFVPDARTEHLHPMTEDSLSERMHSSGVNAALFESKHPTARVTARGLRLFVQECLSLLFFWTRWSRAKRSFLAGVVEGQGKYLK